jgi:hypothetical protein
MSVPSRVVVLCVVMAVSIGIVGYSLWQEKYFTSELGAYLVSESVQVRGKAYLIRDGTVVGENGARAPLQTRIVALRLAYAASRAALEAPFSLSGTDIGRMESAIDELAEIRVELAAAQVSADAKARVLESLFPIDFLRALARLERERVSFVDMPSDASYRRYEDALDYAATAAQTNLRSYRGAYESAVRGDYERTAALVGTISKDDTLRTLLALQDGYEALQLRNLRQKACMRGILIACDRISLPAIAAPSETGVRTDESLMRVVLAVYDRARNSPNAKRTVVGLRDSSCIRGVGGHDYDYIERRVTVESPFRAYAYVGDLFLRTIDASETGPTLSWFRQQKIAYLPYNPFIFYTCPVIADDIARVSALEMMNDALVESQRGDVRYETNVLSATLKRADDEDSPDRARLMQLVAAYANRSAGMDDVIYNVVHGLRSSISMRERGIPSDVSEQLLFATHSGYYGLFLAHNPTVLAQSPAPYTEDTGGAFLKTFSSYSAIREHVPESELIRALALFFTAHMTR